MLLLTTLSELLYVKQLNHCAVLLLLLTSPVFASEPALPTSSSPHPVLTCDYATDLPNAKWSDSSCDLASNAPPSDNEIAEQLRLGHQALAEQRWGQASIIFEGILLAEPWRLGVWLDYALTLDQQGDAHSARAIYQSLLQQQPPSQLIPWLQLKAQLPPPQWRYSGAVSLQSGRDSNLNRAPTTDSITLTLPTGVLAVLPLTSTSRANAGTSQFVRLDWQGVNIDEAERDWVLNASFNYRSAPNINNQDYLQSSIGVSRGWMNSPNRAYRAMLTIQSLRYNGMDAQRTVRMSVNQTRPWLHSQSLPCTINFGGELEKQSYPMVQVLNGHYLGLALELGCQRELAWQVLMRAGTTQAEYSRPGGNQRRIELNGQLAASLRKGIGLMQSNLTQLHDQSGYSPLLANNAVRSILQWQLKLEYQYPLGHQVQAYASSEIFEQRSNLPLFTLRGKAGWLGLRYQF